MENENKFFYKNMVKSIYGIFGIFVTMNGVFMYRTGKTIEGIVMGAAGLILLFMFYYYTRVPYVTLLGTSKLRYKSHPFYPEKIISEDYITAMEEEREGLFRIHFSDNSGKTGAIRVNIGLVEKNRQDELYGILKRFFLSKKDDNEEIESE